MQLEKLKQEVFDSIHRFERKSGLVVKCINTTHDNRTEVTGNTPLQTKALKSVEIEVEII
jgi:hypothetical protein